MTIGIIVAIPPEFKALGKILKIKVFSQKPYKTAETVISGFKAIIIEAGIGKVSAAGATQYLIDNYSPLFIVNLGIGAAVNENLEINDVVITNKFIQWDFNSGFLNQEENWHPSYGGSILETQPPKSFNLTNHLIATGDSFINSKDIKKRLRERGIDFIDMESGSIAQICNLNKISFIAIKGVSDKGEGLGNNFRDIVRIATENSLQKLITFLSS